MKPLPYTGRFAPSPTGRLHLGSLLAAVASYLDARAVGGRWLVRMEDLDTPRVVPGSAEQILETLERFGLRWDGEIVWQSRRTELYEEALSRLTSLGLTFECSCSRRELADPESGGYPGTCRSGPRRSGPAAIRFRVDETRHVVFHDRIQGEVNESLGRAGDVIVRRRDGHFAYQLAVVVDDAAQGVTDVVRGADLMPSTFWQIEISRALGLPAVRYAHVPVIVEPDGTKLAKSRRSVAVEGADPGGILRSVLRLLGLPVPADVMAEPPDALLDWAAPRWSTRLLEGLRTLPAPFLP